MYGKHHGESLMWHEDLGPEAPLGLLGPAWGASPAPLGMLLFANGSSPRGPSHPHAPSGPHAAPGPGPIGPLEATRTTHNVATAVDDAVATATSYPPWPATWDSWDVNATWATAFGNGSLSGGEPLGPQDQGQDHNNWWALLALFLVLATAAGNILVCLAITWERRLQNVTNYFLMSLAITDLMVAVLVMPVGILTLVKGERELRHATGPCHQRDRQSRRTAARCVGRGVRVTGAPSAQPAQRSAALHAVIPNKASDK
ncbi:5-hydroxytryptamine receptor 2A [Frankliniella fusca]|uniref:5-hydroxytryptamine receptor 2A n=1 Tax=Frankliniella fusca TaxID=407009 RepID=A0AAE1HKN9_9NEOP|nr:5-hydroxytryptamine receptor 2A [Frankliniella fusca]